MIRNNHIREELSKYARKTMESGLVVGPGGNLSARSGDFMYVSPSGFAIEDITPDKWVEVNISNGEVDASSVRPSSEMWMHLYAYRANPNMKAMIHTHPVACIAFTLIGNELPMMFPDQVALVGKTAFISYVLPTTEELAQAVAEKVIESSSILLGNHGLVTWGRNLREAFYRTQIVEESCKIFMMASAVGKPSVLDEQQCRQIDSLESEKYRIKLLKDM